MQDLILSSTPQLTFTALLLSALPTVIYTCLLWRLDRYEKEPLGLLLVAFFWGALPAIVLAIGAESELSQLLGASFGPDDQAQIVAPIVEEILKASALIALFRFARHEFNGVIDGIIYGALVGFGFAMSENLLYYLGHPQQILSLWILRSVAFGFNHAFFTSIVGIALGVVRHSRRRWLGYALLPWALFFAIMFHHLHNVTITNGLLGIGAAWLVDIGGVVVVGIVAVLALRQEQHWITTQLPSERASGLLDQTDLEHVLHPSARLQAELQILWQRGWQAYLQLCAFHHLLTELAFLKHQLASGDRHCCEADVEQLRKRVLAQRALILAWH